MSAPVEWLMASAGFGRADAERMIELLMAARFETDLPRGMTRPVIYPTTAARAGEYVPCDKPAVAVGCFADDARAPDECGGYHGPVCAYHTTKQGTVPLTELIDHLRSTQ